MTSIYVQNNEKAKGNKNCLTLKCVRCGLYFALSLPTDTAVPLSHGEDGLPRGKNYTGQLNIQRGVVAVVRKEYQNFEKCDCNTVFFLISTECFRTNRHNNGYTCHVIKCL